MYKLSMDKKVAVISALVEGCSVRSTVRMTGVAKGTILRLLAEVGEACEESWAKSAPSQVMIEWQFFIASYSEG